MRGEIKYNALGLRSASQIYKKTSIVANLRLQKREERLEPELIRVGDRLYAARERFDRSFRLRTSECDNAKPAG